ncbi:MAG: Nif3-like dinuclear metal center hexameric protein, partial [Peptococcaceae bacterium]|nr:Nif3-like dinuclear metal center hexameric protein [Peptococcaceae bacterium]
MSIRCQSFLELLEQWAPVHYAEEWDNVGLHAGDRNKEISRIMVALSPGEDAVNAAVEAGVDMLLTHHPLIFRSMKQINSDTATGRSLLKLIRNDINLYCAHTNLDIAKDGVNDVLAQALELEQVKPLADITHDICYKVVVYVPAGYEEIVRQAMCKAGAGCIGNYSGCTFQAKGTGTFLPGENTNPFIGEAGRMEYAEEYRLETVVPQAVLSAVIRAMEAAHPYEEVAYDVFRLENGGEDRGIGRVGQLKEAVSLAEFLDFTASKLSCNHMTY